MKQTVATLLVLLTLTCSLGKAQDFLDQAEIDRIAHVIENNEHYPPLQSAKKPLVFGLIMSFGGNIDSSGVVPGVRVALDRINNDTNLLPGYTLHYALSDSRVSLRGQIFNIVWCFGLPVCLALQSFNNSLTWWAPLIINRFIIKIDAWYCWAKTINNMDAAS